MRRLPRHSFISALFRGAARRGPLAALPAALPAALLTTLPAALLSTLLLAQPALAQEGSPAPPTGPQLPQSTPATGSATPATPHPYAYGILVGTNEGGAGQARLRYAEDDARKIAQVFRELGRFDGADMRVLEHPDPDAVLRAIDDVGKKLSEHAARNEQAVLVFYYSGHAKANAFSLGQAELPIALLRERLSRLPTTLTLVVLDACQSGQFARIKGAEPAADFSFNSVSRLTTKGLAVMASSSAQELSQESDELKSSYFTHHLLVGLRGAADLDGDGKVSLDEAYRYAYRRTLAATAQTQVGAQHVTLETDLGGQGDVPMTYPSGARAQLELAAPLEARVLMFQKPSGAVVAELQKTRGAPVRLAFASGSYEAFVRGRDVAGAGKIRHCRFALADDRVTTLEPSACEEVRDQGAAKGQVDDPSVVQPEPWTLEASAAVLFRQEDAWTRRLQQFGYKNDDLIKLPNVRASMGASHGIFPHVSLALDAHTLAGDSYYRNVGTGDDRVSFDAYGLAGWIRAQSSPIGRESLHGSHFLLYGQAGAGLSLAFQHLTTGTTNGAHESSTDTYWGYQLGAMGGVAFQSPGWLGIFAQAGYEYAPTIHNLIGETHDSGGPSVGLGLRARIN
jgi:hypothetical protein